ncbi:MAG: MCE family protein [Bdellovibrionales bacterium]|nr:MCE family protein [Bdellovibrionales bacterium]
MKVKFNKFERVAGIFVLLAIVGSVAGAVGVAIQKGWLERKVKFHSYLTSAEGLHAGTEVHMQGLRAGGVDSVDLMEADRVRITYSVFSKFASKIKEDSKVQLVRPFLIGEKVVEISVGDSESKVLKPESEIEVTPSFDIMQVMSGKKMGPLIASLEKLTGNMQVLVEAFADTERTKSLVKTFDQIEPLVKNLNVLTKEIVSMARTANKKGQFEQILGNLLVLTKELNKVLPAFNKESPDVGVQLAQVVKNLNVLTLEFQKLTPAIAAVAPELPKTSLRAVEALNEAVVTLKAMQKSFFLRGNVQEVRDEEAKQEKARVPAAKASD